MISTVEAPAWLEESLQEIKPEQVTLWVCLGRDVVPKWWQRWSRSQPANKAWRALYATKEEAVASACQPNPNWEWNCEPAQAFTLSFILNNCRVSGDAGVRIRAYRDGQWVIVREFPVDVPFFGEVSE